MFGLSARFMPRVCRICKNETNIKVSQRLDPLQIERLTVFQGGTAMRCSRCKGVWYCSAEHQREDFPSHKDKYLIKFFLLNILFNFEIAYTMPT